MAEYINREKALDAMVKSLGVKGPDCLLYAEKHIYNVVKQFPAADVRPVVRGHWIGTKEAEDMGDIMKEFTCSSCGCCEWDCTESESFNFCPNCGADMREES